MEFEDISARIVFNIMQMIFSMAQQRIKVAQGGRGIGKSTLMAWDIKEIIYKLKLSKNFILGETYQNILTKTLPSTIDGLALLGFHKDIHYFIGRYPPKAWNWPECYNYPLDPKHSIFFYTGVVYDLLSEDVSSRGANYASGLLDEGQNADQAYFEGNVMPTMRLKADKFKDNPYYRKISIYCSMPRIRKAEWIFNYEELAKSEPTKYFYISGPSSINRKNLPDDWFLDQKRLLLPSEYAIEIDNIRPQKVIGGFYPLFDDKYHSYTDFDNDYLEGIIDNNNGYSREHFAEMNSLQDADVIQNQALEISMDYGAWFNGIVTGQESRTQNIFRFLSAMSIDDKERFEDLLTKWCTYYRFHQDKTVYYWYDQTAKDTDARTEQYPFIVGRVLKSFGWTVINMDIGQTPSPDDRYRFFGYAHKGDHPNLPKFLYNRHHCKWLIVSMNGADIRQGKNGFEKDKRDEKIRTIDQRTTTHFSDAHDTLAVGKYGHRTTDRAPMARPRIGGIR
jgi:hypothetical protein